MRVFVAETLQTMRVMAERCAGARVCLELSARVLMQGPLHLQWLREKRICVCVCVYVLLAVSEARLPTLTPSP